MSKLFCLSSESGLLSSAFTHQKELAWLFWCITTDMVRERKNIKVNTARAKKIRGTWINNISFFPMRALLWRRCAMYP